MQFIYIVLYMVSLLPLRGDLDLAFRIELAKAIVAVTSDPSEQLTLVLTARYESGFRRNVARCEIKGDKGKSHGSFQVQPICAPDPKVMCKDRNDSCGSLEKQAALSLRYMRRSAEVCPENKGAAKLNVYTSGHCDWGFKEASLRYHDGEAPVWFSPAPSEAKNENVDQTAE